MIGVHYDVTVTLMPDVTKVNPHEFWVSSLMSKDTTDREVFFRSFVDADPTSLVDHPCFSAA
jgi:hypothetical protein